MTLYSRQEIGNCERCNSDNLIRYIEYDWNDGNAERDEEQGGGGYFGDEIESFTECKNCKHQFDFWSAYYYEEEENPYLM